MNDASAAGNPWILGSPARDFSMLLLPGVLGFFIARSMPPSTEVISLFIAFAIFGWIDNGHVYTTIWRTLIDSRERRRHSIYLWGPLVCIALVFIWAAAGWPGLWVFAVYVTLFHNFRQLWGFNRWYQKLAGRRDHGSSFYFHALLLLPVVAFHTRPGVTHHAYLVPGDVFHWPHPTIHLATVALWLVVLAAWIFREWSLWQKGVREHGRLYGFGAGIIIYAGAFFLGDRNLDTVFPLVMSHGISYIAVSAQTARRLKLPGTTSTKRSLTWMLLTALLGGGFAYSLLEMQDFNAFSSASYDFGLSVAIALYLGPLYAHYLFDAWLWTGRHPQARTIFEPHSGV